MNTTYEAHIAGKEGRATEKQDAILAFMAAFMKENGHPPTVREIGARFGIKSVNGVMCHLRALARKGLVRRPESRYQSRGWRPVVASGTCPTCGHPLEKPHAD